MSNISKLLITAAFLTTASSAMAQTTSQSEQQARQQERITSILGALFGDRSSTAGSLDSQWALGRTPLANQRVQFDSRIDSDARTGALDQRTAYRLKADYAELVQLETRYGADRIYSMAERTDLTERYNALSRVLANQTYGDTVNTPTANTPTASVSDGQAAFIARVDALIASRRITRVTGTRLKTDYRLLVQTESNYLRDGTLDDRERDDLDARLDALDSRVGDTSYTGNPVTLTPRARLAAITTAISSSNLSVTAKNQIRVEQGDLSQLEAAYARLTMTADDRRYLENRLSDLEQRLQMRSR